MATQALDTGTMAAGDRARPHPRVIAFPMVGNTLGGSHESTIGLLRNLDPERFLPVVIHERGADRIADFFRGFRTCVAPGFEAVERPGQRMSVMRALNALRHTKARRALLTQIKADMVHTNDGRSHAVWGLAARLAGLPLVWHHRADPDARGLNYVAPLLATRVLSVSRFALPADPDSHVLSKAQVIHSPFDTGIAPDRAAMRERLVAELDLQPDTLVCGYFGLLIARKRPVAFVEAVARLRELSDRPVVGLIFGEPAEPGIAERVEAKIAELGMQSAIRVMGFRRPGHDWIAACDYLLVTAVREPLGRTLVEANLVGTPVVATRSGGNVEALAGGMGILVVPDDPQAMAAAVVAAERDEAGRFALNRSARQAALERFGMDSHARSVMTVYDSILGEQPD